MPNFIAGRPPTPEERRLRAAIAGRVASGSIEGLEDLRREYRALTVTRRIADMLATTQLAEHQRRELMALLLPQEVA